MISKFNTKSNIPLVVVDNLRKKYFGLTVDKYKSSWNNNQIKLSIKCKIFFLPKNRITSSKVKEDQTKLLNNVLKWKMVTLKFQ